MKRAAVAFAALLMLGVAIFAFVEFGDGTGGQSFEGESQERLPKGASSEVAARDKSARERDEASAGDDAWVLIKGRCVDEEGQGLAGCRLELSLHPLDERRLPKPELGRPLLSKRDGRFEKRLPRSEGWLVGVVLRGEGRIPRRRYVNLEIVREYDAGDLVLRRGVMLSGSLRDTDGQAVSGVDLSFDRIDDRDGEFRRRAKSRWRELLGRSTQPRGDGRFALERHLAPGRYRVKVGDRRRLRSESEIALDASTPRQQVDLVVFARAAADTIRGVIVGPRGKPVARATVFAEIRRGRRSFRDGARSDRRGRFVLVRGEDMSRDEPPAVYVTPFEDFAEQRVETPVAWGTKDLRIELHQRDGLAIRVVDEANRAVEDYSAYCLPYDGAGGFGKARGSKHADGRCVLLSARKGKNLVVVRPRSKRLAPRLVEQPFPQLADPVTIELRPLREFPFEVVYRDGSAVAKAKIELIRLAETERLVEGQPVFHLESLPTGAWTRGGYGIQLGTATTDASGAASLRWQASRMPLVARVTGPNATHVEHAIVLGESQRTVRIVVDRAAALFGTLRPAELVAVLNGKGPRASRRAGLVLISTGKKTQRFPRHYRDMFRFGQDGSFRIEGVPAGTWGLHLKRFVSPGRRGDYLAMRPPLAIVTLRRGQRQRVDVDLRGKVEDASIDLRVLHNGKPATDASLVVKIGELDAAGKSVKHVAVDCKADADGRWNLRSVPPGALSVRVNLSPIRLQTGGSVPSRRRVPRYVEILPWRQLRPGETFVQTLSFDTGTLRVRLENADGTPAPGRRLVLQALRGYAYSFADSNEHGLVEIDDFPFVESRVHTLPRGWKELMKGISGEEQEKLVIQLGKITPTRTQAPIVLRLPLPKKR